MRPPRIAVLALFLAASIFILGRAFTPTSRPHASSSYPREARSSRSVFGFMYYNTPFSLFPPNAAISLTDDNSTSFAARPAAFGPKLAATGLSGQLWVGSGFAEDSQDGDGELGCSDLPGWGSGNSLRNSFRAHLPKSPNSSPRLLDSDHRESGADASDASTITTTTTITHAKTHPGRGVASVGSLSRRDASSSPVHADIQSIQEAAEIQGKVVLLMRGGCGFLEKVMWAQRRGAIAVIVGDNQKGGPLIQMFAHGDDVENVTVPSVFTALTTAHLLSSLTQPGSFIEDTLDDNGNPVRKVQQGPKTPDGKTRIVSPGKATEPSAGSPKTKDKRAIEPSSRAPAASRSWLSRLLGWGQAPLIVHEKSRPPSSGRLGWEVIDNWSDESDKVIREGLRRSTKHKLADDHSVMSDHRDSVMSDHRDTAKDVDSFSQEKVFGKTSRKTSSKTSGGKEANGPQGGSITPGSGDYTSARLALRDGKKAADGSHSLISRLFGDDKGIAGKATKHNTGSKPARNRDFPPHEGLWVTITPTSSASPFFDTLLVLVISPLVTLTVVYALLVVRARIRRRRWRAPKSVVDRLPVRTYHTAVSSPSPSPRLPSPSGATPTTPLLQHSPTRSRPRSRTTTGVVQSESLLVPSAAVPTPAGSARSGTRSEHEKGAGGFSAEWRKYMGRQVECVVCLEEYVDGVSRVMSLPCGHEFHADCITPWLTTRRRTCPICKGDVVRSLARGARDGPRYEPYNDGSDEDMDVEAPGSRPTDGTSDLERGILSPRPGRDASRQDRRDGWLAMLSSSFNPRMRHRSQSPQRGDRSR
ncbi:hypothetical protein L249_2897 [Ophiocordyceps polyrhachis-furcata BCC 54312]|uniref:RING-type E3 ubiquitin transferase n=1 Tax=Ophiocordyceps polyrhachis-furcata BCC 54312 TaxID=1330021 RepID=A0A367LSM4_9HYPO|nr:hypothetical protein L249_2897 [Ophiocordyceps polyrhachis-furcata BCC 54312]